MKTPKRVNSLQLQARCSDISLSQWEKWMENATRANKKIIDGLIKKHLPDLYHEVALNFYNPYNYFKTKKHLIMVHSGIEFFILYD